jgi:hypothetical protein
MARETWFVWSGLKWVECGSQSAAACAADLFGRLRGVAPVLIRSGLFLGGR